MFDLSFVELMVLGVIALVVLGPEKLPQAVRTAGTYYAKFRRTVGTLKAEMEAELDLAETRQMMQEELLKVQEAEAQMQKQMAVMRDNMRKLQAQQASVLDEVTSNELDDSSDKAVLKKDSSDKTRAVASKTSADLNSSDKQMPPEVTNEPSLTKTFKGAYQDNPHDSHHSTVDDFAGNLLATKPWQNMWFLLGDYDRKKRLPPAPWLPDYQVAPLLNAQPISISAQPSLHLEDSGEISRYTYDNTEFDGAVSDSSASSSSVSDATISNNSMKEKSLVNESLVSPSILPIEETTVTDDTLPTFESAPHSSTPILSVKQETLSSL